jgi:all-trans-retinol 13,14-reductase
MQQITSMISPEAFLPLATTLPKIPFWILAPVLIWVGFLVWLFHWPARRVKLHPRRASRFRPELVLENGKQRRFDTIVIGSGSGGCACANLLAQSGQRVLILEQHTKTGGCTHSFRDRGCEWDTGLHYTSAGMGRSTCRPGAIMHFMTQGLQKWTPLQDPYDEVIFPPDDFVKLGVPNESSYRFVSGADETIQSVLASIDPEHRELEKRARLYMDLCTDINSGFTALGISRVLPSWMHFLVRSRIDRLMKFAAMTVRDVQYGMLNLGLTIEELLKDGCPPAPAGSEPDPSIRRLKAVLTHPIGDYAVQPRDATMAAHGVTMAHYQDGACYCVGPTQQISVRSSSMVREFGGEVLTDATVREIILEHGRAVGVRVSNTSALAECKSDAERAQVPVTELRAKAVVCATSVYNLYNNLLPQDLAQVKEFQDPEKRTIQQSNGHVFLFCKIKGDPTELKLPAHNLWYFNSYDIDDAFDAYFTDPVGQRPPTVYIGFPCTKDTSWKQRFPGVSNCILISDGLWEWFEKWQDKPVHNRGSDYEEFKEKLSKHLLEILFELVPEVKDKIEFSFLGTPLSEQTYLNSFCAGSYGTKCLPSMFAKSNRRWTTSPHTSIPGLYLAGSDAFLPAVCGAMYGGCFGAIAVLGHLRALKLTLAFIAHFAGCITDEDPKIGWIQAYILAWKKFMND